nr:hypothetical protein [Bradyrhizobium yuanmingense]
MAFPSFIQSSFILEEAVNPESAKDSVRYRVIFRLGEFGQHLDLSGQSRQSATREKYEIASSPRGPRARQDLAAAADILIARLVIDEIVAAERAVVAL